MNGSCIWVCMFNNPVDLTPVPPDLGVGGPAQVLGSGGLVRHKSETIVLDNSMFSNRLCHPISEVPAPAYSEIN